MGLCESLLYTHLSPISANVRLRQERILALVDKLNDLDPTLIPRLNQGGSNAGALTRDAKQQVSPKKPHTHFVALTYNVLAADRPKQWEIGGYAKGEDTYRIVEGMGPSPAGCRRKD
jgi:hypothetical protein